MRYLFLKIYIKFFNNNLIEFFIIIFNYRYPLHFAALRGDIDIMNELIRYKADVNKQDILYFTILLDFNKYIYK